MGWNSWLLVGFMGGVMLIAGCVFDAGSGLAGNSLLDLLGVTAGATDVKSPAQGQPDADDGDTQTGEFEGEHQFGAEDGDQDDADDDVENGPNDQVEDGTDEDVQNGPNDQVEDGTDEDGENGPNDELEDEQDDDVAGNELQAVLSGGTVRATVEYEQEADHTSFEVEVTGGQPDATLDVAVNGVVVLSITLDASGAGEFEFSSAPEDADEQQLPAEFPVLSAGDIVALGALSGPLETEQDD
ncbi:MAG: hypothetical protein ABIG44_08695 [Planctomycetota bacterium]